jgi:UDP-galactopyranose mutase
MNDQKHVRVVGAGFTGAVIARRLAEQGHIVTVIEERDHVAGNCHSERDPETGVMVHVYGPHIFHTDDDEVWGFITDHCTMMPYRHQVKAQVGGRVFSMPINLHTINQFFDTAFSPHEAQRFIAERSSGIGEPASFADQALRYVGPEIYHAFFRGYTLKQWGVDPAQLPASILKRLPLRFTYDDNYFAHRHQGIPREGYTAAVASILDHPRVEVLLSTRFEDVSSVVVDHTVYTGPLDRYFGHRAGRLGYRTLHFERDVTDAPFQGTAVMNYCDEDVPFTRITEHMYFAPWEMGAFSKSVIYREYSAAAGSGDIPYYPVRLLNDKAMLADYVMMARHTPNITFAGRLGNYAYLDMDVSIRRALDVAAHLGTAFARGLAPDAFVHKV